MSKKLFLALSLAVVLIGGAVTIFVAIYCSPSNRTNRAISSYEDATEIQTVVTQKYYDALVFEKTYLYEKTTNGYHVSENVKSLNQDPFSADDFTVLENEYFTETFSLDFFRLKDSYFKNCALTEETDLFTFTADVKESKTREFFRSSFPETLSAPEPAKTNKDVNTAEASGDSEAAQTNKDVKIKNLSVTIVFTSSRPQSIKISFTLNSSFFTLQTTFSYD